MFIDVNQIVNEAIMSAYMKGRKEVAQKIQKINVTSKYENWIENQEKIEDTCFGIMREYQEYNTLGVVRMKSDKEDSNNADPTD